MGEMSDRIGFCDEGIETLGNKVGVLQSQVASLGEELQAKLFQHVNSVLESWRGEKEEYQAKVDALATQVLELTASLEKANLEIVRLRRAGRGEVIPFAREAPRVQDVPKPKEFKGSRNAEEIDNFLWHMERYFEVIQLDDASKVSTASLYLVDLAATWWRRKHGEMKRGLCMINTWEAFVAELKRQFYPANANHEARKRLKELKHGSSLHEYVRDFSALMLNSPM